MKDDYRCSSDLRHADVGSRLIPAFAGLPSERHFKHPKRTMDESAKLSFGGAEFSE
jgi:hypothetical protein